MIRERTISRDEFLDQFPCKSPWFLVALDYCPQPIYDWPEDAELTWSDLKHAWEVGDITAPDMCFCLIEYCFVEDVRPDGSVVRLNAQDSMFFTQDGDLELIEYGHFAGHEEPGLDDAIRRIIFAIDTRIEEDLK